MKRNISILAYALLFCLGLALGLLAKLPSQAADATTVGYRDDALVVFAPGLIEQLNAEYNPDGPESLYCLIGREDRHLILVDGLLGGGTIEEGLDYLVFDEDPPCQTPNAIGSLHTHPLKFGCEPSQDDLFTWGEMRSPEPLINMIQCGMNQIHIFKMPGKREEFNFNSLRWEEGMGVKT